MNAGTRAARAVVAVALPKLVRDVQTVLKNKAANLLPGAAIRYIPLDGLGGLSLWQAQRMHEEQNSARVARRNLFFIRMTDTNPPPGSYMNGGGNSEFSISRIGGGLIDRAATVVGNVISNAVQGATGISIGRTAMETFDMLAVDVSYGIHVQGDHAQIGSTFIDQPSSLQPDEMQLVMMDDEAGTIKRWFEGKLKQVAHQDGTVGLPAEYLVDIEIVHAIPSDQIITFDLAYTKVMRMRAASVQVEQSRRDPAVAEIQLVFAQFDPFMGT